MLVISILFCFSSTKVIDSIKTMTKIDFCGILLGVYYESKQVDMEVERYPILRSLMSKFRNNKGWNKYFEEYTYYEKNQKTELLELSDNTYIKNCKFQDLTNRAISSTGDFMVLIESCFFIACRVANDNGGAVRTSSGQCVIEKTCSFSCYTLVSDTNNNRFGQFCYIEVHWGDEKRNEIHESSVCGTPYTSDYQYAIIYLLNGIQDVKHANISNNTCFQESSIVVRGKEKSQYINTDEVDVNIRYCTMSRNNATYSMCICLTYNSGKPAEHVYDCNVIFNTQDSSYNGLFFSQSSRCTVKGCCIFSNSPNAPMFHAYSSGSIDVVNCTTDAMTIKTTSGTIITSSATADNNFIHAFTFFETGNLCKSEYDSVDDVKPITPVPLPDCKVPFITCDSSNTYIDITLIPKCTIMIALMMPNTDSFAEDDWGFYPNVNIDLGPKKL